MRVITDNSPDKWRDIPGFGGRYQACRAGLIRRVLRDGFRFRKTCRHRDGYDKMNLGGKTYHVHTLIALTFLGPRPAGAIIDHIDGNHANNVAWNLRYVTAKESSANRKPRGKSQASTGEACIYHHGRGGYFVRANPNGKKTRLGRFATIEEARATLDRFRRLCKAGSGVAESNETATEGTAAIN